MKTILNLAGRLLESAKFLAKKKFGFRWKKSHYGKMGFVNGLDEKDWSEIRDRAYDLSK